ncbi:MAG: MarR family winged helix-turn-helix transcriptional regulator [Anaerolineae bacterium]
MLVATSCVAGNLRQTTRAVSQLYDEAIRPSGLRGTQFTLLIALAVAGAVPITGLAEALVMDRTTLSRNIKPLERQGWVRIKSGADRRQRMVMITPTGKAVLAGALPLWEAVQSRMINELGENRFATLKQELVAVAEATRSE